MLGERAEWPSKQRPRPSELLNMKLTTGSYATIVSVQVLLLVTDLCINSFQSYARRELVHQLALFIVQDVCLVLALTCMLLTFFSTHTFQAGLIEALYDRFRFTIVVCMVYFMMTTALHVWSLSSRWSRPLDYDWSVYLHALFVLQRTMSVVYYYLYKRAALRISDPRFSEGLQHIGRQLGN